MLYYIMKFKQKRGRDRLFRTRVMEVLTFLS